MMRPKSDVRSPESPNDPMARSPDYPMVQVDSTAGSVLGISNSRLRIPENESITNQPITGLPDSPWPDPIHGTVPLPQICPCQDLTYGSIILVVM
jgi:hypothetical protein